MLGAWTIAFASSPECPEQMQNEEPETIPIYFPISFTRSVIPSNIYKHWIIACSWASIIAWYCIKLWRLELNLFWPFVTNSQPLISTHPISHQIGGWPNRWPTLTAIKSIILISSIAKCHARASLALSYYPDKWNLLKWRINHQKIYTAIEHADECYYVYECAI